MTKNWKYYLGLSLFIYSLLPILLLAILPFLGLDLAESGTVAVVFLVSGEVAFYASAVLLGKEFLAATKKKIASWFHREAGAPRPVSRARHRTGVVLLAASFLPYYAALLYLLFFTPQGATLHFLAWSLVSGEVLGMLGLFLLGGQFWERLKRLFLWQDEQAPAA